MFERFFASLVAKQADRRLVKEVAELRDQVEAMERTIKNLKLEWEESYDKLHHLMSRVTKRAITADREKNDDSSTAQDARREDFSSGPGGKPSGPSVIGTHATLQAMRARNGLLPR